MNKGMKDKVIIHHNQNFLFDIGDHHLHTLNFISYINQKSR